MAMLGNGFDESVGNKRKLPSPSVPPVFSVVKK